MIPACCVLGALPSSVHFQKGELWTLDHFDGCGWCFCFKRSCFYPHYAKLEWSTSERELKAELFKIKLLTSCTSIFVPCQWSRQSLVHGFPWRHSLNPPGDLWLQVDPPDSARALPPPAAIGREDLRWLYGWWRHHWSRGCPSEEGQQTGWDVRTRHSRTEDRQVPIRTHWEAVEDDVFMWWGRGARRQGNRAVIGQAERQALTRCCLEVVSPWSASGLKVEGLEEKTRNNYFWLFQLWPTGLELNH